MIIENRSKGQGDRGKLMAEQPPRGKASELVDDLLRRPLTPEEAAKRRGVRPALRWRANAPSVEVDEATPVRRVLDRLSSEALGSVGIREPGSDVTAVVVPVERYLQLVATELATDQTKRVATLDGQIVPSEDAFAASHVEQVNPQDT
jgi:hypothetical protein